MLPWCSNGNKSKLTSFLSHPFLNEGLHLFDILCFLCFWNVSCDFTRHVKTAHKQRNENAVDSLSVSVSVSVSVCLCVPVCLCVCVTLHRPHRLVSHAPICQPMCIHLKPTCTGPCRETARFPTPPRIRPLRMAVWGIGTDVGARELCSHSFAAATTAH